MGIEPVVHGRCLQHRHLIGPVGGDVPGQLVHQLGVGDRRAVVAVVAEHERRLHRHPQRPAGIGAPRRQELCHTGFVEHRPKDAALVLVGATLSHVHGGSSRKTSRPVGLGAVLAGEEPLSDRAKLVDHGLGADPLLEPVVLTEGALEHREHPAVPGFVVTDPPGHLAFLLVGGDIDDAGPAQLGAALELHVQTAEVAKRAVSQLLAERPAQLTGHPAAEGQPPCQRHRRGVVPEM